MADSDAHGVDVEAQCAAPKSDEPGSRDFDMEADLEACIQRGEAILVSPDTVPLRAMIISSLLLWLSNDPQAIRWAHDFMRDDERAQHLWQFANYLEKLVLEPFVLDYMAANEAIKSHGEHVQQALTLTFAERFNSPHPKTGQRATMAETLCAILPFKRAYALMIEKLIPGDPTCPRGTVWACAAAFEPDKHAGIFFFKAGFLGSTPAAIARVGFRDVKAQPTIKPTYVAAIQLMFAASGIRFAEPAYVESLFKTTVPLWMDMCPGVPAM